MASKGVEEVDAGRQMKFQAMKELLRFLGQSFEEGLRREQTHRGSREC
jgi:hypothetical protein